MKIKMKMKTKTALFSIIVISLFIGSIGVQANCLYEIESPETVVIGDSFVIKVLFTYETDADCLYGDYVHLFYSINNLYVPESLLGDNILYQGISSLNPRPDSVSFTIFTASEKYDLSVGDIFRFKVKYQIGSLWADGSVHRYGVICSETYSVTITDTSATETSVLFVSILSTLLILSAVILQINKRGKKP